MRKNDNGEPAACACPPAGAPGRQPPFRVMIADPDPIMRKALAEIVARTEGFEVTHSLGGVDGVPELYRKDSPDVVFVDLVIPWLSGVDAARGILGADPGAQVYGIFPYDHFDLSEHASGVRLAGHIQKPVSREQVEGILAGHRRARAPKGSLQLSVLSEIVSVRDFGGFYGRSYDIAVSLQEEAGRDSRSVRAKLRDIQSALSGGGPAEPGGPAFSASEPVLLSIDAVVQLCLFNIVNGVFTADSVRFNSLLKNLFRFLDRNVTRRIGLDDLAEKCCISQGHLSRLFRKCFNI
ncbi:MAG: DNA-binding response regulator, partial [Deltaproteobacteria bacterium]|nr:DNA-binding response regulator [Deltaproteobacteria bacterium]